MNKLYVPLREDEFARLRDLALADRRRPQDMAAILIARALTETAPRPRTSGHSTVVSGELRNGGDHGR